MSRDSRHQLQGVRRGTLATASSSYARKDYGLSEAEVATVGVRLRQELVRERNAGTIQRVSNAAQLRR